MMIANHEVLGKGVKIVVIDSGLSPHDAVSKHSIVGGVSICHGEKGLELFDNYSDEHGHGTGVVGIIARRVPEVQFYIIKILNEKKCATSAALIRAFETALKTSADIIHFSLGTMNTEHIHILEKLCEEAGKKGMYVVAAGHNKDFYSLPSDLQSVIKVLPGMILSSEKLFYFNDEFFACGIPQMVPWLDNKYALMGGSSFAAPHISATIAGLIEMYGKPCRKEMVNLLKKIAHPVINKNLMDKRSLKFNFSYHVKYLQLLHILRDVVENVLQIKLTDTKSLWEQGLNCFNSFEVLSRIEDRLDIQIEYWKYNYFDFNTVYTLLKKITSAHKHLKEVFEND